MGKRIPRPLASASIFSPQAEVVGQVHCTGWLREKDSYLISFTLSFVTGPWEDIVIKGASLPDLGAQFDVEGTLHLQVVEIMNSDSCKSAAQAVHWLGIYFENAMKEALKNAA